MSDYPPEYTKKLESAIDLFDELIESGFLERIGKIEEKIHKLEYSLGLDDAHAPSFSSLNIVDRVENIEHFIKFLSRIGKDTINNTVHSNGSNGYYYYNLDF